jgi:hypothetical protein
VAQSRARSFKGETELNKLNMKQNFLIDFAAAVAVAIAAVLSTCALVTSAPAAEPTTERIKIGSASHHEAGCSESSANFKIVIPDSTRLDLNYKGVLAGIERVYTEANGTRRDDNWAFADNGSAVTFSIWLKGGGTRIRNPFNSGSWCQGASGANLTVEVWGHYIPK